MYDLAAGVVPGVEMLLYDCCCFSGGGDKSMLFDFRCFFGVRMLLNVLCRWFCVAVVSWLLLSACRRCF